MEVKTREAQQGTRTETPKWTLAYLDIVETEARKFLTDNQYTHVVGLFDELAYEPEPWRSQTQNVEKIEDFYELKEKGGVLGKINVRVYFAIIDKRKLIMALAAYKKEAEGQTPTHMIIRVRNRLRQAMKLLQQQIPKRE